MRLQKWWETTRDTFDELHDPEIPDELIDAVEALGKLICKLGCGHRWELDHCNAVDHAACLDCGKAVESVEEARQCLAQISWHRRFPDAARRNPYFDGLVLNRPRAHRT